MNFWEKIESTKIDSKLAILFFTSLFFLILLRTAWISDDAAITIRTVLNFVSGYGPTFNIEERVQAYTHPLWFFVLSLGSLISGNVFYATFFVSISLSVIAFMLLLRSAFSYPFTLVLIGLAVVFSKAFVDFSTSGLENPLSHILLFFAVLTASTHLEKTRSRLTVFFLICSGLYLNRPDLLAIIFPLAVYLAFSSRQYPKALAASVAIAALPVIIWTLFSLFYYGFPLPNTAYAKLGAGIPFDERIIQGLKYLFNSSKDPVTLFAIIVGVKIGFTGSRVSKSLATGIIVYLAYVIYIGGDFMAGRFFTAPLFMSLIIIAKELSSKRLACKLMLPTLILGSITIYPNFIAGTSFSNARINSNGIADERGFYYQDFGLLTARKETFIPPPWTLSERKVGVICGGLGYNSIHRGPSMHYIDSCALADPLLARLPAKANPNWRIGHFERQLPTNYQDSIKQGKNLLADEQTARYWESIRIATRGELFSTDRLVEIAKLNFGLIPLPDWEMYRTQDIVKSTMITQVPEAHLSTRRTEGTAWNAPGNIVFDGVLEITLTKTKDIHSIDISLDHNDTYEIFALQNQRWLLLTKIDPKNVIDGLAHHRVSLQRPVSNITKIRINATSGDQMYSIGHLLINGT